MHIKVRLMKKNELRFDIEDGNTGSESKDLLSQAQIISINAAHIEGRVLRCKNEGSITGKYLRETRIR